ncbi:MAG TPA: caspase family protein [Panacibacter sp.]|nr:caspase family protein [Panacibacter sp.]
MKKILVIVFSIITSVVIAQTPELIIPTGHAKTVTNVLYTTDGKFILSSSENMVKVWERSSGRLLKNIVCKWGDKEPIVVDMDASPDGKTIAIATYRNIHFFSLEDFTVKKEMHFDEIEKVLYSKDGSNLFVAMGDEIKTVAVADVNAGTSSTIFTFKKVKEESDISNLSLSTDGKQLLICMNKDGSALLNSNSGELIKMIPADKRVIAFTPEGNLLGITKGTDTYLVNFDWLDAASLQSKWHAVLNFRKENDGTFDWLLHESTNLKNRCVFNPVNNDLVVSSEKHIFTLNSSNQTIAQLKYTGKNFNKAVAISKDGKNITIGNDLPEVFEYSLQNQAIKHIYGSSVFVTESIQAANDSSFQLLLNSENGNINNLRFGKTNFTSKGIHINNSFSKSAISKDGKLGAYLYQHTLHFFNTETMQEMPETIGLDENIDPHEMAFSDNGKWLVALDGSNALVFDVASKKLINKFKTGDYALWFGNNYKIESISSDGKKLVTYSIKENSNGKGSVLCYDIATGNILWEKSVTACCFKFINSDKQVFMVRKDQPALVTVDALTGSSVSEKTLPFQRIYAANISNDLKKLAFTSVDYNFIADNNYIQVWDMVNNKSLAVLKGHSYIPAELSFLANSNFLVSASQDNSTRIWDIGKQKELGTLITFEDSNDWVFVTPDGRFDASPGALQTLYYTKGKDVLPLEALYEQYYTPKLISRLIAGETFDSVPDIGSIKIRPNVKMTYASAQRNLEVDDDMPTYENTTGAAEISITANASDDAVDEIRLFHNGKVVTLTTRNLIVADDDKANTATKKYTVNLQPGANTFRAIALNSQRTESKADEITVVYKEANTSNNDIQPVINNTAGAPIIPVDKNATLHLVVVGINAYQNKSMSLNYALADATSFKEEVEKDAKSIITNVKTYFVTDNDASRKGIENALASVKQNAKPEDVFVFYYAGHGVIGKNNEFYLVPTDVSDLKNVQAELENKGIPAKLLQEYAIDIPAQKQLFILDACQSAGAFQTMLTSDANQQKSIAVVARSTGTHWIAASGAQQFANEFSSLGHGAFTYVLLEALKGAASSKNMITVNDLKNYLQQTVPALMQKYHGTPQYPASYGFGNDFPVEVIK